jgi:Uncharacterized protein conserved in bacteria (DUF2188)
MESDHYFVVLHKGEWKIKHNGRHSHTYETQADAIRSAIDAAHTAPEGGLSQVLVKARIFCSVPSGPTERIHIRRRVELGW